MYTLCLAIEPTPCAPNMVRCRPAWCGGWVDRSSVQSLARSIHRSLHPSLACLARWLARSPARLLARLSRRSPDQSFVRSLVRGWPVATHTMELRGPASAGTPSQAGASLRRCTKSHASGTRRRYAVRSNARTAALGSLRRTFACPHIRCTPGSHGVAPTYRLPLPNPSAAGAHRPNPPYGACARGAESHGACAAAPRRSLMGCVLLGGSIIGRGCYDRPTTPPRQMTKQATRNWCGGDRQMAVKPSATCGP